MFSNLISGDNPMKFMNLLQTVGQKIQDKVSSEGIDQNDLINESYTNDGKSLEVEILCLMPC